MYKHKKKQNGITLISLVISIIVMLILAGVTLNAAIGDNGIISQAQYATFLNEMAAVEEAVQLWKINQKESAIPANGLCQEETLSVSSNKNAERLNGEVGYYRVWSMSETMPAISVLADVETFNNNFGAEVVYYPAGAQDLYYLDNEGLGIDSKKEYIIDAVNSMVYSTTGISIKGVRVYSTAMAKAVMSGNIEAPLFAEAEVSGTGAGESLAGNVQDEYLPDGTKNPDYNPYGFQIISDVTNDNIYKLYNNGDLYAKGIKGVLLNSNEEEMNQMDKNSWLTDKVPSNIPGAETNEVEIILGYNSVFVIDKEKNLWAWGENNNNKFGLTDDEQIEFTSLIPKKLNVDGKKVEKVFAPNWATFVITTDGELYVSGINTFGQLGIGSKSQQTNKFEKIDFPEEPRNIKEVYNSANNNDGADGFAMILTTTGNLYYAGRRVEGKGANVLLKDIENSVQDILEWSLVDTETMFPDFDWQNASGTGSTARWHNSYWFFYSGNKCYQMLHNGTVSEINPWGECEKLTFFTGFNTVGANLVKVEKIDSIEWWYRGINKYSTIFEEQEAESWVNKTEDMQAIESENAKISEIWFTANAIIAKRDDSTFYGRGALAPLGLGVEGRNDLWQTMTFLNNLNSDVTLPSPYLPLFISTSTGEFYGVDCVNLLKRDYLLEKQWKQIANDVKIFNAKTDGSSLALVKNDGYLYIRGGNSSYLGLNREGENVLQLTKVIGEGATEEVKQVLTEGIKDYWITEKALYVLTNDGTLLASGTSDYLGFGAGIKYYELVKLKENVTFFESYANMKIIKADNEVYWWGSGSSGQQVMPGHVYIPTKLDDIWNECGEWKKVLFGGNVWTIGENSVLTIGIDRNDGFTCGTGNSVAYTPVTLNTKEKIINGCYDGSYILLGESGNLYGAGLSKYLGDGNGATGAYNNVLHDIPCEAKFVDIIGGKNFAIAITEDGKVYGTGMNQYGILGRWIGIDRSSPNSRYKTAFDWVECPELEI